MCKLNVLILGKYITSVTRTLGEAGLVHLVDAVAQSGQHLLGRVDRETGIQAVTGLLDRCTTLLDSLGVEADTDEQSPPPALEQHQIEALLSDVERRYADRQGQLDGLLKDAGLLGLNADRLRTYPVQNVRLDALRDLSHLYIVTGQLSPVRLPAAAEAIGTRGLLVHDEADPFRQTRILVVTSRRNRWGIDADLEKLGFVKEDLPNDVSGRPEEERGAVETRLEQVRREMDECRQQVLLLGIEFGGPLLAAQQQLLGSRALLQAQQRFGRSAHLYCISGWAPRENETAIRALVDRHTDGTGVIEVLDPEDDERVRDGNEVVPVLFVPNPWMRPFQGLITNFGAPRYNEIDPSLFVAASFVLMFGIMFGDVGQGAVIAVLGVCLRRTRHRALKQFREGGLLLVFCGLCAMFFGVLYGSVFGYEELPFLKPLWLRPLHDVTRLLKSTVVLGVICISIAILINIVNKIRNRHWFEGVFDKFGVLGIIFYWGALGIGLKAAKAGELDFRAFLLVVVLPLALLFVREPLHNLLLRRKALHGNIFTFILESCIETMETVTAFLGSTISFVRVGAFALSHAALCLAIYSVTGILRGLSGGILWCALVLLFGNLLIIFMEGMVAMIQGIRLQYYELFSKYYAGDGVLYHPFTLTNPSTLSVNKGDQEA